VVLPGRHSTDSHPVRVAASLWRGRLLLLSRDITALEQAEAMRRDFVANVSHEIRTPLTVLMGFVETANPAAARRRTPALPGPDGPAGHACTTWCRTC
jgi:signal transduction histidine kinase